MDISIKPAVLITAAEGSAVQGKRFTPRAGAYFIDLLTLNGIGYLSGYVLGNVLGFTFYLFAPLIGRYYYVTASQPSLLNYLVSFMQTVIFFTLFEWLFGRTLGKVIVRMQVVSSNGEVCSFTQALTRSVYRLIDGLFLGVVAYANMKAPAFQRLGDKKAQTLVVSASDPMIKAKPSWWRFILALVIYLCIQASVTILMTLPHLRFIEFPK
jgi:uncharacterized RDD family membrane protein YckC